MTQTATLIFTKIVRKTGGIKHFSLFFAKGMVPIVKFLTLRRK